MTDEVERINQVSLSDENAERSQPDARQSLQSKDSIIPMNWEL